MLNVFEPCTLQLGDKSFYSYSPSCTSLSKAKWANMQNEKLFPRRIRHCGIRTTQRGEMAELKKDDLMEDELPIQREEHAGLSKQSTLLTSNLAVSDPESSARDRGSKNGF